MSDMGWSRYIAAQDDAAEDIMREFPGVFLDTRPWTATHRATPHWTLHYCRKKMDRTLCGRVLPQTYPTSDAPPQGKVRECQRCYALLSKAIMGSSPVVRVYLAGPMNGCTDDEAKSWRDYVRELLELSGIEVFDPMVRDYRDHELEPGIAAKIVEQDKADIMAVDIVLVCFDKPSVGTSMEVLFAWQNKKKIIVVNKSTKPLSPWLLYHSDLHVMTLEAGVTEILRFRDWR